VFASRTGVRLELRPAPRPHDQGSELPTWEAHLIGVGLDASIICPEATWEPHSLADFLFGLDEDSRGWEGDRFWQSEEAELRLSVRHNKLNTVFMGVVMEQGAPPRWRCEAELELDPGGFQQLVADARRLADG
jgi:hypothetical protein